MTNENMILRAGIDNETVTFQASDTGAGYIIPEVWSRRIEEFEKARIVMQPLGVTNTELLGNPGDVVNIASDQEITAAAVSESVKASVSSVNYGQVTVTPSEVVAAVSVTRKALKRAFNPVMEDQSRILGYGIAKKKDADIIAALVAGAGSTLYPDSVAAVSDLASSNTLDTDVIADGISTLRGSDVRAAYLVIHPGCENSLLKDANFIDASKYGGREAILNGEIGRYLGVTVFTTTQISANATKTDAYDNFVLGPRAFVVAEKMGTTLDSKYEPLDRAWTLVAVADYGVSVLNSDNIVMISAWKGI